MATENQGAARDVLYAAIEKTVNNGELDELFIADKARALRELATAYRLVAGGPQPGSVTVQNQS
ncbi:hypothetical protein [Nocardioides sp.]|uniref:hypothetical protein n=1 Tax=Nocardioides sp. TaxID=35761 RepID=UPI002639D087|nr:hypothetical protein [Nocardioides sp.]